MTANVLLRVILPSGNQAVYDVQPQHLCERPDMTLPERVRCYGTQLAHEKAGTWFVVGKWTPVTDPRTIAMLRDAPLAD